MDIGIVIGLEDKFSNLMTEREKKALHELIMYYQDNAIQLKDGEMFEPSDEYKGFLQWCKENAPKVLKMERPITEKQYRELVSSYGLKNIRNILMDMDNWKPLLKQNTNANRTALKWLEMRGVEPVSESTGYTDETRPHGYTNERGQQWNAYTKSWTH